MATVKGQNLRITIGGRAIIAALDCQLHVSVNMQQLSTKDDEGAWQRQRVASVAWDVTANAAVTSDEDLEAVGIQNVSDLVGQTVQVGFNLTNGDQNRDQLEQLMAGEAIVSDASYTAQNRQRTTCQVKLTGKSNMLIDLRYLVSADNHLLRTADGHILMAAHDPNA